MRVTLAVADQPATARSLVHGLGDLLEVLRRADPADKAEVYRQLGLRLTYHPGQARVTVEARPLEACSKGSVGGATPPFATPVSRGDLLLCG